MTIIEEHANWNISRELGFNYCHTGLVRWQPFVCFAMCFGFWCHIYLWDRNSSWYCFKYMYWCQCFMFYQDLWGRSPCWPYAVLTLMHMLLCYHRLTDWHVTTPWLTTTMSSFGRCVTETRCLKSLSRKKTSSGGTGALVFHHMAYSE